MEIGAIIPYLLELVAAVVLAVGGTYGTKFLKSLGLKNAEAMVDTAVAEGVSWAKKWAKNKLKDEKLEVTDSEILNQAVNYVLNNAPKALKEAGLDEDMVKRKVESWL